MLRRCLWSALPFPPDSVPVRIMWQLEWDTSRIPAGLEYFRGVRMGIDQGVWFVSLECWHDELANSSLPYCRYGVGYCLAGRQNCFEQSDRSAGHTDVGLHPHGNGL